MTPLTEQCNKTVFQFCRNISYEIGIITTRYHKSQVFWRKSNFQEQLKKNYGINWSVYKQYVSIFSKCKC